MKKTKKLIAIIIAMVMVIGLINLMPIPESQATITEDTNTGSVTVTGLEAGVTAYLYQLTTVNYDYTSDQPSDPEYTWNEQIQTWIETNYGGYIEDDGSVSSDFRIHIIH